MEHKGFAASCDHVLEKFTNMEKKVSKGKLILHNLNLDNYYNFKYLKDSNSDQESSLERNSNNLYSTI